jgi:hypothetical protein
MSKKMFKKLEKNATRTPELNYNTVKSVKKTQNPKLMMTTSEEASTCRNRVFAASYKPSSIIQRASRGAEEDVSPVL